MMEVKDYQLFFSNLSKLLLFINAILFFKYYIKQKKVFKIFTWYLLFIFILQIISFIFWYKGKNNLYLSHFYFIIQFLFLSLFYATLFKSKKQKITVLLSATVVILIITVQYVQTPSLYHKFNLLEIVLTSLVIVSFSVIHFYNSLTEKTDFIYINSGIFIYLLSSTLIFCSGNFVNESNASLNKFLWLFNSILFVLYQVLIFTEWFKSYRNK